MDWQSVVTAGTSHFFCSSPAVSERRPLRLLCPSPPMVARLPKMFCSDVLRRKENSAQDSTGG